MLTPHQN